MAETQTVNTYQYTIPPELQLYAKDLLAKTQALTNAPYVPYGEARLGSLSPLQLHALQNIANTQVPAQIGVASTATNEILKDLMKYQYSPVTDYTRLGLNSLNTGAGRIEGVDEALDNLQYNSPFQGLRYSAMAPGLEALSKDYNRSGSDKVEQLYGDIPKVKYNNRASETSRIADDINGSDPYSVDAYLNHLYSGGMV